MSITDLTTASAWMAALAIVALIAAGWRKPARATANSPRGFRRASSRTPVVVAETPTPIHRRPALWRRVWAIVASSIIAVVLGAMIAIFVAAGIGYTVITLTTMLRR